MAAEHTTSPHTSNFKIESTNSKITTKSVLGPTMASSRIFVKGLPPTFTDAEFRKHFSSGSEITDAKIFPNRRIGYVGYKTPEDAQKAVKYYNRTFIRMSKIGVEIARPPQEAKNIQQSHTAATDKRQSYDDGAARVDNRLKRKRDEDQKKEDDPKLKEFVDAMKPKSKKKAWESEQQPLQADTVDTGSMRAQVEAERSDEEYEHIPKKTKRQTTTSQTVDENPEQGQEAQSQPSKSEEHEQTLEVTEASQEEQPAVSDSEWARSRTSRLLGLLDDEEEDEAARRQGRSTPEQLDDDVEPEKGVLKDQSDMDPESSIPTPPSDEPDDTHVSATDPNVEAVRASMRLFVRNLPYATSEQDLEIEFESFGNLEEVRIGLSASILS
jgi:multiple RNA-binding domain-containing protein 1